MTEEQRRRFVELTGVDPYSPVKGQLLSRLAEEVRQAEREGDDLAVAAARSEAREEAREQAESLQGDAFEAVLRSMDESYKRWAEANGIPSFSKDL